MTTILENATDDIGPGAANIAGWYLGATGDIEPCRALVPIVTAQPSDCLAPIRRPHSGFVTQLIAIDQAMPQTRLLRRASSQDATASYRSIPHAQGSHAMSRMI